MKRPSRKSFIFFIITVGVLVSSGILFRTFTAQAVPTDYWFNNAVNTNPATLGNYWLDAGLTVHAGSLPNLSDDELTIVAGATYNGSPSIRGDASNDGTITGNASFYNSGVNNGIVDGDATFYEDRTSNVGTVGGQQIRRFTDFLLSELDVTFAVNNQAWVVIADGIEIDSTYLSYDDTTLFERVNGGTFSVNINYTGKTALGTTLHLNVEKTLKTTAVPDTSDFTLTVNGSPVTVTSVSISREKVILSFGTSIAYNDTVTLAYTVGSTPIETFQGLQFLDGGFSATTIRTAIPVGNAPVYSTLVGTKLYVSNNHSSSVTVIDTTTNSVLSTISVGNYPELSVLVGTKLYVGNLQSSSVSVIDTLTDTVVSTISTVGGPYFLTVKGNKIYVSGTDTNAVSVINTTTDTVTSTITVGSSPWRSGVVGSKLYVPNRGSGTVSVINTATDTVSATIAVGSEPSYALAVGTKVYVSNYGSGNVSVINTLTDTVSSTITTAGNPYFSNVHGTKVFVPTRTGNRIVIINSLTDTVITSLVANDTPYDTNVIDNLVYVSNVGANTVTIVNPNTNSIVQTVATGAYPFYITAVGKKIYSSDNGNSGVSFFDTTSVTSQLPNLISFSSATADGEYSIGDTISITANFGQSLAGGSTMTVALNSGASVVLSTVLGTTLSGTYTVGSGQSTPDLSVSSITSASVTDTSARNRTSYSLPSSQGSLVAENSFITRNLGDTKNIVIGSYQAVEVGEKPYQMTAPITVGGIPYIYVANQGDNSVSVIRKTDHTTIAAISVGSEPYGLSTISISGTTYVYVANTGSNSVSVINTNSNSVVATVTVGVKPYYVAVLGTKVYVTNSLSNTVSVIDTATNTVTATIPVGTYPRGIRAYSTYLYVSNYGDPNYSGGNSISVIDSATNTVSATIVLPAGSTGPRGITSLGTNIYVANFRSNNVSVINTATNAVTATITVGTGPRGIVGLGSKVYVENFDAGTISVIDTGTNAVTATINVGHSPAGMSISGTDIYLTRFQDDAVSILNTNNNTLRSAFPVISNIRSNNALPTKVDISWATDIEANSTVEYGLTTDYGTMLTLDSLSPSHSISIINLPIATTYHYRITSTDATGNSTMSGDYTFTTTSGGVGIGGGGSKPPVEPIGPDSPLSGETNTENSNIDSETFSLKLVDRVMSKIFIDVNDHGRLWYQFPTDGKRYEVTPAKALDLFRIVALGISNNNLNKIPTSTSPESPGSLAKRLKNLFLLQVENKGQTWYVDQLGFRHFVTRFNIIGMSRNVMTGILNKELQKIPVAETK